MLLKLVIVGTVAAVASAFEHPINERIVNAVRTRTSQWIAHDAWNNPMRNKSVEEIKGLLGTIVEPVSEATLDTVEPVLLEGLPATFDWREQGNCVHPIRDQAQCGSCWAFAATEAFSDRICIASNGETDVVLSPQDMVSCDPWDMGCNGGILSWAWSYIANTGVVTDDCYPYTSQDGTVAKCSKTCSNGAPW